MRIIAGSDRSRGQTVEEVSGRDNVINSAWAGLMSPSRSKRQHMNLTLSRPDTFFDPFRVTWNMWGEVTISGTWTHQDTPDPSEPVDSTELPSWTNSYP